MGPRRRDQDDTLRSDQQARKFQPQVKLTAMQGQQLEKPLADGGQPQTTAIIKAKKPRPPHCHLCKTSGHIAQVCKADIGCYICN